MSALSHLMIVELAEGVAGEFCGKLLADFGAEVIKVERPGSGSPTRALGPFAPTGADPERSGLFAYLNTNKKSVTLDLADESGRSGLEALLARADAVIDDHAPGWLGKFGLDPERLEVKHPRLVVCSITPFGQAAPPERANATDLIVMHASGWGYHTPTAGEDARPPLKGAGRFLASYEGGLDGALCTMACLLGRDAQGQGRFIDISMQETLASRVDYVLAPMVSGDMDVNTDRTGFDLGGPAGIFPCRDGFIYVFMSSQAHWAGFQKLVGEPAELAAFPANWLERGLTPERVATARRYLVEWLADVGKDDAAARAQALGVTLVPVNNPSDLQRSPQFQYRAFFSELDHPAIGRAVYPGVPYRLSATPARIERGAPLLGAHDDEIAAAGAAEPAQA